VIPSRVISARPGPTTARKCGLCIFRPLRAKHKNSGLFSILSDLENENSLNFPHSRRNRYLPAQPRGAASITIGNAKKRLYGEPFSSLGSTPIDDFSPSLCGHPLEKSVCSCAFDSARLICSLHGVILLW
jgi:hypothetical protein